ncbi:unnamed protein product [Effrenium voratum]|nr:unnamed protein product [Effrenium voratum]
MKSAPSGAVARTLLLLASIGVTVGFLIYFLRSWAPSKNLPPGGGILPAGRPQGWPGASSNMSTGGGYQSNYRPSPQPLRRGV